MAQMIFAPSLYVDFFKLGWYNSSIQKLPAFQHVIVQLIPCFPLLVEIVGNNLLQGQYAGLSHVFQFTLSMSFLKS